MSKDTKTTMEELLNTSGLSFQILHRGDVVQGKVLSITEKEALIDVGAKAEGILPQREIKDLNLKPGDELLVYILTPEDREGQILLSVKRAESAKSWLALQKAADNNETLMVQVIGHNKGGLIVEISGVQAFVPFSHLTSSPDSNLPRPELQSALDKMRGEELSVKVIELNREKDRIILSEREAFEQEKLLKRAKKLERFNVGQKVKGEVTSVMPYGLVIKVTDPPLADGVEALVSQDELFWEEKTGQLASFQVGQKITAKVLEVDEAGGKLKLSMKRLTSDPWEKLAKKFKPKDKVKGEISKITSFGVFVKVADLPSATGGADGVEGLLPLTALPKDKTDIKVGDNLNVVVKAIDKENRRLELGI